VLSHHLPVLQVVLPLLAAPICSLLPRANLAWFFALLISISTFVISILLVQQVTLHGVLSYELGGWAPPWGIEYRIDHLAAYLLVLVSGTACIATLAARQSVEHEIPRDKINLFYAAFLLCLTGLLGIVATGDAFNIFVFLEISSLSSYALIAMGERLPLLINT